MKAIDQLIQDNQATLPLKSTLNNLFKECTKVNKIYECIKTGKLNALIPENFGTSKPLSDSKYVAPTKKHITLSFEYSRPTLAEQKKVLNHNAAAGITPDILTMHKIKVPRGYVPIKIVLSYHLHTEAEESTQLIFKVGKKSMHIKPAIDAIKNTLANTKHDSKDQTFFHGNLDINLKDISLDSEHLGSYLNENHEIPFSFFIHESNYHAFHVLIGCERGKSKFKHWKADKFNQLKAKYNIQREKYERKFAEQLKPKKHSVFDMS